MALEPIQQLENLLLNSKNVLIFIPENPDGDTLSAAYAFSLFLGKKEINSTLVFSDKEKLAEKYNFLPQPKNITGELKGIRDFVLVFSTKYNKIMNVRTKSEDSEFKIYITPERGAIDPRDFSFVPAQYKYDLAVVLGSPDKETLGKTYEDNPDIFYELPVVNIDYHSTNENFAQVNIVELTASSVAEVLVGIMGKINEFSIDANIAECLLAGILSATESFQKKNTTPRSLETAARLMDLGADQQKIVKYLYKTQPFHVLKLWGRIMARLKWEENLGLVYAPVLLEDFVQSRSVPAELYEILGKLKDNYSAGKIYLVYYSERENLIAGLAKCVRREDLEKLAKVFGGEIAGDAVKFKMENIKLEEAEAEIIQKITLAFQ